MKPEIAHEGVPVRALLASACVIVSLVLSACASAPAVESSVADAMPSPQALQLVQAAESQIGKTLVYDGSYVQLDYPGGDLPLERGVCTDVVIRACRELGVDLQVEVHEDMSAHFGEYPQSWGLTEPNSSIDHRRVPSLQTYFERTGKAIEVSDSPGDYWPGDIVTWDIDGLAHMGIVSATLAPGGQRYCIVHNFGAGVRVEDMLFLFPNTGHYRAF